MIDIVNPQTQPMESWYERDKLVLRMLEYLIRKEPTRSKEEEQEYRNKILNLYK